MTPTPDADSITCPICGMTTHHPEDVKSGYCGWCHDFTSLGEVNLPDKVGFDLPEPNHQDFYRINAVCRWNDEKDFADTILGVDMASLGYMANVRAGLIQQELTDTIEIDEVDDPAKAGEISERERLVMCWIDAFTAGQKFALLGTAKKNMENDMEEEGKTDGNRRMRRKKKK